MMPNRLEPHVTHEIKLWIDDGLSDRAIARKLQLSHSCIWRIRLSYDVYGEPYPPPSPTSRRRTLTDYYVDVRHMKP